MDAWRTAVLEQAASWLRTPWHHRARVKGAGVDCGHFLIAAYVGAGLVADFDPGEYPMDWMNHQAAERFLGWVEQYLDPVETPLPADVAVWKWGKCFSHGAIVTAWPNIIHAYRPHRAVVYGDASKGALARERSPEGGSAPREVVFYSIAGRL